MSSTNRFRQRDFLLDHVDETLRFYLPNALDPAGGFRQNFYDDGITFDEASKHLVSSCRMVFNFCLGDRLFGRSEYRDLWQHGLDFIRERHWQSQRRGYIWSMSERAVDETNHCYGLAFLILTFATTLARGDERSKEDLYAVWSILEDQFWDVGIGLYADEISPDWKTVSPYRGQNANMHACEAFLVAYEATHDAQFLDRAHALAHKITVEQADKSGGLIWEHFRPDLSLDWDYNKDDPRNLYRPWGFQPGHQTEWSKLLLLLREHRSEEWMLERAADLFDRSVSTAWDEQHGGLFYGFAPDNRICDDDKYFWVQAESFAAAALLAIATGNEPYWDWYDKLWEYCWSHFVDHEHGAWYRILTSDNRKMTNQKSVAGAKCDYHNIGACATVLDRLRM